MSIQVAILKVLASHGSGRATLGSLKHDLAILASSGPDWHARIKRLSSRVSGINIFGSGLVLRDADGWEITAAGREFLRELESVTQDNLPPAPPMTAKDHAQGALIVVGHRFKNRAQVRSDSVHAKSGRRRPLSEQH